MYDNIPDELRQRINWCLWRYETLEGSPKPTKVPYHPSGKHASSTDPQTWCSFGEAVIAAQDWTKYNGIGFFFSKFDPYCGIDLDNPYEMLDDGTPKYSPDKQEEIRQRHIRILGAFPSYAETSPSGKGIHIIVRAKLDHGRRRDGVEMYPHSRYFTMTGNRCNQFGITDCQDMAIKLWDELAPVVSAADNGFYGTAIQSDDDNVIYNRAAQASNGQKFEELYNGNWTQYFRSQSEADFALIDIIAYYTQHQPQIARMFRNSALGQRDKARRDKYVYDMIQKSFDNQLPPMDISAIQDRLNAALAAAHNPTVAPVDAPTPGLPFPPAGDAPDAGQGGGFAAVQSPAPSRRTFDGYNLTTWLETPPPGIIGMIQDYIFRSSPRPVYEISLVASLGLFAGLVGRQFNVSGTGLNHYLMLVAGTGKGKEAISVGISKTLAAFDGKIKLFDRVRGPSEISSGQALLKHLSGDDKIPSIVSLVGEFGDRLRMITDTNSSSADRALKRVLLDLYGKSGAGQVIQPTIYSDTTKNTTPIYSPAFSLIGESTGETYYAALDEDTVAHGLLPRFITVEYKGPRVPLNKGHSHVTMPQQLYAALEDLAYKIDHRANSGEVTQVMLTPEAEALADKINVYCDAKINNAANEMLNQLWNRVHLKILKLAALLAVAHNVDAPIIDELMINWATSLVMSDTLNIISRFEGGHMGVVRAINHAEEYIRRECKRYLTSDVHVLKNVNPELHKRMIIPRRWLQQRLLNTRPFRNEPNPSFAFSRAVDNLVENGVLHRVSSKDIGIDTVGKQGYYVSVIDVDWLKG